MKNSPTLVTLVLKLFAVMQIQICFANVDNIQFSQNICISADMWLPFVHAFRGKDFVPQLPCLFKTLQVLHTACAVKNIYMYTGDLNSQVL